MISINSKMKRNYFNSTSNYDNCITNFSGCNHHNDSWRKWNDKKSKGC